MNISKFQIVLKYLTGGIGNVVDYLLDILNKALSQINPKNKQKIQAVLNIALKVLAVLSAFKWLCPTKWQTAYGLTIDAVNAVVSALEDLNITADELEKVKSEFIKAVEAWKSPDDDTCVDCIASK